MKCVGRKDVVPEEFCIHQFGAMPETTQKCDVTCEVQVCKFSEWSEFSTCPRHCGGYRFRNRTMEGRVMFIFVVILGSSSKNYNKINKITTHNCVIEQLKMHFRYLTVMYLNGS